VALPLADPHVLVRVVVGRALLALRHRHVRDRLLDRVAPARRRGPVVHLPHRPGLAPAGGSPANVRVGGRARPPPPKAQRGSSTAIRTLPGASPNARLPPGRIVRASSVNFAPRRFSSATASSMSSTRSPK